MRRALAPRVQKYLRWEAVEHPVAQHFPQANGPDLRGALRIAAMSLGPPRGCQYIGYTVAIQRDGVHDLGLGAMSQTHRRVNIALQFIRAGKIRLIDDEHLSDLHD